MKGARLRHHVTKVERTMQSQLSWNKCRIEFISLFMLALIKVKTVNLTQIALGFNPHVKITSNYRRLQRFFANFEFDLDLWAKLLLSLLPVKEGFVVTLDRTNWKLGKSNINLLVLGIAYKGIAFPIMWSFLSKAGNSNTQERIELMNRFIGLVSRSSIQCLVADREFIGAGWIDYLKAQRIIFYLRIRGNAKVKTARGHRHVDSLFGHLKVHQFCCLPLKKKIYSHRLALAAVKLADEYMIIITNHAPEKALHYYKKRWEIETLFAALKTRGFNFEDTHLTEPERVNKLLALLALTFCWAHLVGEWRNKSKPLKFKKHQRLAMSIFRYGLDYLRMILLNFESKVIEFNKVIRLLSCT